MAGWVWWIATKRHVSWKRALTGRNDDDLTREDLEIWDPDHDGNGIPDNYDENTTTPEEDSLHLKFPVREVTEGDYVAYMPRSVVAIRPRIAKPGSKGIVRSTFMDAQGAFAQVKWNSVSQGEGGADITELVNQMDLNLLGHISRSHRVTE